MDRHLSRFDKRATQSSSRLSEVRYSGFELNPACEKKIKTSETAGKFAARRPRLYCES